MSLDRTQGNVMLAEGYSPPEEPRRKIAWCPVKLTDKKKCVTYDVGYYYIEGVESTVGDIFAIEIEGMSFYEDAVKFDLLSIIWEKVMI